MSAVLKEIPTSSLVTQFLAAPKKMLIDGKWVAAASGKTFEVRESVKRLATSSRTAAMGDAADVDRAVARAARRAFEDGEVGRA